MYVFVGCEKKTEIFKIATNLFRFQLMLMRVSYVVIKENYCLHPSRFRNYEPNHKVICKWPDDGAIVPDSQK